MTAGNYGHGRISCRLVNSSGGGKTGCCPRLKLGGDTTAGDSDLYIVLCRFAYSNGNPPAPAVGAPAATSTEKGENDTPAGNCGRGRIAWRSTQSSDSSISSSGDGSTCCIPRLKCEDDTNPNDFERGKTT